MTRRALVLAVVMLLGGAAPINASAQDDPVAFIRAIYRGYEGDKSPAWYDHPYSPRLRKLIVADQKAAKGEVGKLDFDPLINGQDWKLSNLTVTLVSQEADKAVVEARFDNLGEAQDLRYDLVRGGGRWTIDEVQSLSKPRWTMSKILAGAPDAFPDQ